MKRTRELGPVPAEPAAVTVRFSDDERPANAATLFLSNVFEQKGLIDDPSIVALLEHK